MIDIKDIYWVAGFYEGEGTVRHRPAAGLEIQVAQSNLDPLERLQKLFGGRIQKDNMLSTWLRFPNAQQRYKWVVNGVKAFGLIQTIYSLLSEKRKQQAKRAIDGQKAVRVRRFAKAPDPHLTDKNWLYENDPNFREKVRTRIREKYHDDPEYQANVRQRTREREQRLRADPEQLVLLREQRRIAQRVRRAKVVAQ